MGTKRCTICAGVLLLLLSCVWADSVCTQETYAIPHTDGKLAKALALYAQGLYFLHQDARSSNRVEAVESLREALTLDPDSVESRVALIEALEGLDDGAAALAEQRILSRRSVNNAAFWLSTANRSANLTNAEVFAESVEALASLTPAELVSAELVPLDVEEIAVVGWSQVGDFEKALAALKTLIEKFVKAGNVPHVSDVSKPLEVVIEVAEVLSNSSAPTEKIWDYISAVEVLPRYTSEEYLFLMDVAYFYAEAKDPDVKLIVALRTKALEADPLHYGVALQIVFPIESSIQELSLGQIARAVGKYPRSPKLDFPFSLQRLELLFHDSNLASASTELDKLRALRLLNAPTEAVPEEYFIYGSAILDELGKHQESRDFLEEGIVQLPKSDGMMNGLAYTLALEGCELDRALDLIDGALKNEPENFAYLDTLGWVLYKRGDYEGALRSLEQALSFGGTQSHEVYDHVGDVLIQLNRSSESPAWWAKSYSMKPASAVEEKLRAVGVNPEKLP